MVTFFPLSTAPQASSVSVSPKAELAVGNQVPYHGISVNNPDTPVV